MHPWELGSYHLFLHFPISMGKLHETYFLSFDILSTPHCFVIYSLSGHSLSLAALLKVEKIPLSLSFSMKRYAYWVVIIILTNMGNAHAAKLL